jgi:hypothetical protein
MLWLLCKGIWPCAVINNHTIKAYGEVEIWLRGFLTWILDGGMLFASRPGHFTPGGEKKAKWGHCRSGSFEEEKNRLSSPGTEPRFLGYLTRSVITTYCIFLQL